MNLDCQPTIKKKPTRGKKKSETTYFMKWKLTFQSLAQFFRSAPHESFSHNNQPISWSHRSVIRNLQSKISVGFKSGQQNGFLCSPETVQHYCGNLLCNSQNHKYLQLEWTLEKY